MIQKIFLEKKVLVWTPYDLCIHPVVLSGQYQAGSDGIGYQAKSKEKYMLTGIPIYVSQKLSYSQNHKANYYQSVSF